jgi:hypothetical protein
MKTRSFKTRTALLGAIVLIPVLCSGVDLKFKTGYALQPEKDILTSTHLEPYDKIQLMSHWLFMPAIDFRVWIFRCEAVLGADIKTHHQTGMMSFFGGGTNMGMDHAFHNMYLFLPVELLCGIGVFKWNQTRLSLKAGFMASFFMYSRQIHRNEYEDGTITRSVRVRTFLTKDSGGLASKPRPLWGISLRPVLDYDLTDRFFLSFEVPLHLLFTEIFDAPPVFRAGINAAAGIHF